MAGPRSRGRRFLAAWWGELPRVAASLTTALILLLVSLTFKPVRDWLFQTDVATYPLACSADPLPAPGGRRIVEFYVVNRTARDFTGEELQSQLDETLRGSGSSARTEIVLPFNSSLGRIETARQDADFNNGKGELVVRAEARGVRISVRQIDGASILRAIIVLADMPDAGPFPRDAKVAVPFEFDDIRESCYTRG
jgi:hypothetical protein